MGAMTSPSTIPTFTLNDGTEMPALGFGTYKLQGDACVTAIRNAIELGYRHFDTASMYDNEEAVGRALRDAIAAGDVQRDDLFVTTKVWNDHHGEAQVQASFQTSLATLGLDYLDCCMIHWPCPQQGKYVESYAALAKIQGLGQLQSIAVANFYPEVLDELLERTGTAPALNQVELHPGFSQAELREYHAHHGIITEAWSPLGRGKSLEFPVVREIAKELGVTSAQVVLRWLYQLGCSSVPKAQGRERQQENLGAFHFELAEHHLEALTALDAEGGRLSADPRTFPGNTGE